MKGSKAAKAALSLLLVLILIYLALAITIVVLLLSRDKAVKQESTKRAVIMMVCSPNLSPNTELYLLQNNVYKHSAVSVCFPSSRSNYI